MNNVQLTPELQALLNEIQAANAARSAPGVAQGATVHDAAAEAGAAAREFAGTVASNVWSALKWGGRFTKAAFRGEPPKPRLTAAQVQALKEHGLL